MMRFDAASCGLAGRGPALIRVLRSKLGWPKSSLAPYVQRILLPNSKGTPPMSREYTVVCECGAPHSVRAYESGDLRMCRCRRQLKIPMILRTTEQVIDAMIKTHQLPSNELCPFSSERADATVSFLIEQLPRPDNGVFLRSVGLLIGGLIGYIASALATSINGNHEEDVDGPVAIVPMRVSKRVVDQLSAASQDALLNALRTTPVYAHLLDEHGNVSVSVVSNPT